MDYRVKFVQGLYFFDPLRFPHTPLTGLQNNLFKLTALIEYEFSLPVQLENNFRHF